MFSLEISLCISDCECAGFGTLGAHQSGAFDVSLDPSYLWAAVVGRTIASMHGVRHVFCEWVERTVVDRRDRVEEVGMWFAAEAKMFIHSILSAQLDVP